jgi:type VI secretion system protein ImpK
MSDNPFSEPDDSDRTVIRPAPGGRRPPVAPPPAASPGFGAEPTRQPMQPASAAPVADGVEHIAFGNTPLLAAASPLLALLTRLNNTLNQPDPGDLRERAIRELRVFESAARDAGVSMEQLRPAHYALCASLDDVVLNTPWGSVGAWAQRSLVATFHQEVRAGERFFVLLNELQQNPGPFLPVLELMYLCLSLGFQGRYRLSPQGPAQLDKLREDLYSLIIRQRPPAEAELSPHWQGLVLPYKPATARLPVWVVGVAGLAVIGALFVFFSGGLNARSDDLFARMIAAPPAQMPQLARVAPVRPPPPPPPVQSGVLDKLRKFLAPEIQQGLVSVLGDEAVPIVRIRNRGIFASGSATVDPRFSGILERVGQALNDEPGKITVVGHTDNQPVHTVQFPSNFQLSLQRAQAARVVMLHKLTDGARVSAEGHADAEPIAPNDTAAGRDENRRIEVVLRRGA